MKTIKRLLESLLVFGILFIILFVTAIISNGEYTWYLYLPLALISIQTIYWLIYAIITGIKKIWK